MRKLTEMTASERLENAFSIAEKELKVSRLLTIKGRILCLLYI